MSFEGPQKKLDEYLYLSADAETKRKPKDLKKKKNEEKLTTFYMSGSIENFIGSTGVSLYMCQRGWRTMRILMSSRELR